MTDYKRALVVGAGPSLKANLEDFQRLGDFDGVVIATDASIQHLLKRDIILCSQCLTSLSAQLGEPARLFLGAKIAFTT